MRSAEKILVIGANGQIGSALSDTLRNVWGTAQVITSDLRDPEETAGEFVKLDATDVGAMAAVIKKYKIKRVFHLAAILSANGEQDPMHTWRVNMQSYFNVLETAREFNVRQIFFPSSIAVFGDHAAKDATAQWSCLVPSTVYGISKAAGENWSQYYHSRYGVDIRSLRYPGIISHQSPPGGGTTDYAVDIYHKAVQGEDYTCYLRADAVLPMIYMDDAIRATMELMEAPAEKIRVRTAYNIAGMSFSPAEISASLTKIFPDFRVEYKPDFRQQIADSWPRTINDVEARTDWNWKPQYNLHKMTEDMVRHLSTPCMAC